MCPQQYLRRWAAIEGVQLTVAIVQLPATWLHGKRLVSEAKISVSAAFNPPERLCWGEMHS